MKDCAARFRKALQSRARRNQAARSDDAVSQPARDQPFAKLGGQNVLSVLVISDVRVSPTSALELRTEEAFPFSGRELVKAG